MNVDNVSRIFISNMCCSRCVAEVNKIFKAIKLNPVDVQLGEVVLSRKLSE